MPYSCTSSVFDWSQKCDRSERKIGHAQPGAEVFVVVPCRGPNTGYSPGFAGYSRALRSCCLLTETGANANFVSLLQEFLRSKLLVMKLDKTNL